MKITFSDHGGKGLVLAAALRAAGHDLVEADGDVLLIDHDLPWAHYGALCDAHARVLVYPHGAPIVASGDGQWPVHPHTVLRLEYGPGQVEVLRRAGYPRRVEVIGWALCPRRAFAPRPGRRILLAPQHAMGDGYYDPELRAQNVLVHEALADLAARGLIGLTVRWVGFFSPLGILPRRGVRYVEGAWWIDDALMAIAEVDCVVGASGTFSALAVARGVPTVMYGQLPLDDDWGANERHPARSWPRYRDYIHFPLDATETDDLPALLARACASDADVAPWRDRFIGPPFDPVHFVNIVEEVTS
jgi:hypothetical protein